MQENNNRNNNPYAGSGFSKSENEEINNNLNSNSTIKINNNIDKNTINKKNQIQENLTNLEHNINQQKEQLIMNSTNSKQSTNLKRTIAITILIIDHVIISLAILSFIFFIFFLQIPVFIAFCLGADVKGVTSQVGVSFLKSILKDYFPIIILIIISLIWSKQQLKNDPRKK